MWKLRVDFEKWSNFKADFYDVFKIDFKSRF